VAVVAGRQLSSTGPYFAHGLTPDWVTPPSGEVTRAVAQAAARSGGAARWIGLGPLSNLAGLLAHQPGLARRLFVTQLTGTSNDAGQALPSRNFRLDPAAARQVLRSARPSGRPPVTDRCGPSACDRPGNGQQLRSSPASSRSSWNQTVVPAASRR
jgi:hypothetical protein